MGDTELEKQGKVTPSSLGQLKNDVTKILREQRMKDDVRQFFTKKTTTDVVSTAKRRKEELENEGFEQDIRLKRHTLYALFAFLVVETFFIFYFSYLQGTEIFSLFHLEEWSFKLLVVATISQITFMLNIAVKHLFPYQRKL